MSSHGFATPVWRSAPSFALILLLYSSPELSRALAASLLLDFGPTVPASSSDKLNSPAHFLGVVPGSETNWNVITADLASGAVYSDGSSASGVTLTLGRSDAGASSSVNLNNKSGVNVSGLTGSALSSGVYVGSSPMRDGIFAGATTYAGTLTNNLGVRINGLPAGPYTVFVAARNSNSAATQGEQIYFTNAPSSSSFVFSGSPVVSLSNSYSAGFVQGDNYNRFQITLNADEALFIVSAGTATTEKRGFMNLIEVVPGFQNPTTNSGPPVISPKVSLAQDHLTMTYTRPTAASNYVYAVAVSSNLVNWASGTNYVNEFMSADDGSNQTHVAQEKATVQSKPAGFMRLQVAAPPKKIQGAKVVAFGDSITYGQSVPVATNWVSQLTSRFALNMVNAGIGGNTSSQGLARMQADVLNQNPDFVIINFGMNDHVMTALDAPQVSTNIFRNNLMAMVDRVRTNNAIPVLVTVNYIIEGDATQYYYSRHPSSYYSNVGGAQAWVDYYIQIVRDVAAQKGVDLIDVRNACNAYDRYEFLRSLVNGAAADDGVHPYLLGSTVYAQVIGDYLAAHY